MVGEGLKRWGPLLLAVGVEGGLAVLALLIGWPTGCWPLADFSWDVAALGWGVAATMPMLCVLVLVERWPIKAMRRIRDLFDELLRPMFRSCSLAELALISLFAGVGEEMMFRGLLQAGLGYWWGPWPALIVASIVFGLFHPLSLGYVILATGLGIYLGAVWLGTGNLLAPIVAHALYDFIVLVYLLKKSPLA